MSIDDYFGAPFAALSVEETEEVSAAVKHACDAYKHAQAMFDAAVWRIAREPHAGTLIEEEEPYRRVMKFLPNKQSKNPILIVRYYYDKDSAVIDWVKYYPYDKDQAINPPSFILH